MITQHYKLPITPDMIEHAEAGQQVYEDEKIDQVVGFIDFVSDSYLVVMLFQPDDINIEGAINIQASCDVAPRLNEIFKENPSIRKLWE